VGYFPAVLADLTARAQAGALVAFDSRRLYEGEYLCVMRKDHPLEHVPLTLDNYCAAHHMLVSFSGRSVGFIDEALASLGRSRKVVLTVNQFFTAARVVMGSDLLTILPRRFVPVTGMQEQLVLRDLPFDVTPVHVDALWRRRGPHPQAYDWLLKALGRASAMSG
jgi:DNA-binding transcriptional LysR family regulator